jgi:hypothetical protein
LEFGPDRGQDWAFLPMGGDVTATVTYRSSRPLSSPLIHLIVKNTYGAEILHLTNRFSNAYPAQESVTGGTISCSLQACPFVPGRYVVDLYFGNSLDALEEYDVIESAVSFDVDVSLETLPPGLSLDWELGMRGVMVLPAAWKFEQAVT